MFDMAAYFNRKLEVKREIDVLLNQEEDNLPKLRKVNIAGQVKDSNYWGELKEEFGKKKELTKIVNGTRNLCRLRGGRRRLPECERLHSI